MKIAPPMASSADIKNAQLVPLDKKSPSPLNIFLRAPFRHRRIVLLTNVLCVVAQPLHILKQIVPTEGTQLKIVRHHDCFCRTHLCAQVAQNTNFEVDVIRINDLPLFLRVWVRFSS
ncbi:hypothetical protein D3C84_958810 [compost metagenome]